jgi:hypothetical protein
MSGRADEGIVTVHCPRCGSPFLLAVQPLAVGYAVDVETAGCECELNEDEYEALTDRAVGAYARGERAE